jgi:hypothetical protein
MVALLGVVPCSCDLHLVCVLMGRKDSGTGRQGSAITKAIHKSSTLNRFSPLTVIRCGSHKYDVSDRCTLNLIHGDTDQKVTLQRVRSLLFGYEHNPNGGKHPAKCWSHHSDSDTSITLCSYRFL